MKERPILFQGEMVRAILDGTKTQTRRIMKAPWDVFNGEPIFRCGPDGGFFMSQAVPPYGKPGDRLWVRETHAPQADCWGAWHNWMESPIGPKPIIHYAADGGNPFIERWRPSIHMPRWASRILLEVTGVRVERLQDISEEDAIAEGIEGRDVVINGRSQGWTWRDHTLKCDDPCEWFSSPIRSYRTLWESINGLASWEANPWVWVIEFRRIKL